MDTPSSGGSRSRPTRQQSRRLQMHAPSSLKVAQQPDVSGWNAAIPLLSPLDTASPAPTAWPDAERREERRQPAPAATATTAAAKRGDPSDAAAAAWKHPAAPFYYEPAPPGGGPAFLLSLT